MPPERIDDRKLSSLLSELKQHASKQSVWLATGFLYRGDDRRRMAKLARIAASNSISLIATNDVLYHHPWRRMLQDVVTCIRKHVTLDQAGRLLTLNAERYLKPPQEMTRLFADFPDAIAQTQCLARALPFLARRDAARLSLRNPRRLRDPAGAAGRTYRSRREAAFSERHQARHPQDSRSGAESHRRAWLCAVLPHRS